MLLGDSAAMSRGLYMTECSGCGVELSMDQQTCYSNALMVDLTFGKLSATV